MKIVMLSVAVYIVALSLVSQNLKLINQRLFRMSVYLLNRLFICQSVRPSVRPSVRVEICLLWKPPVCLSICWSV
jgi:hypothetical protein